MNGCWVKGFFWLLEYSAAVGHNICFRRTSRGMLRTNDLTALIKRQSEKWGNYRRERYSWRQGFCRRYQSLINRHYTSVIQLFIYWLTFYAYDLRTEYPLTVAILDNCSDTVSILMFIILVHFHGNNLWYNASMIQKDPADTVEALGLKDISPPSLRDQRLLHRAIRRYRRSSRIEDGEPSGSSTVTRCGSQWSSCRLIICRFSMPQ